MEENPGLLYKAYQEFLISTGLGNPDKEYLSYESGIAARARLDLVSQDPLKIYERYKQEELLIKSVQRFRKLNNLRRRLSGAAND